MLIKIEAHRYMYYFLKSKVTLFEFEQWIYDHEELEEILGETEYLQFISRDYTNQYAYEDTEKQIRNRLKLIRFGIRYRESALLRRDEKFLKEN